MNGYYHGETETALREKPVMPAPEPIPVVLTKANDCLTEVIRQMQPIFNLLFSDEVRSGENGKCENMTQLANDIAMHADEILQAVVSLRERLGAEI